MKCGKCKYFAGHTKRPTKGFKIIYGVCRRFPPMIANRWADGNTARYVPAGFLHPEVHSDGWCGEFQSKESEE